MGVTTRFVFLGESLPSVDLTDWFLTPYTEAKKPERGCARC